MIIFCNHTQQAAMGLGTGQEHEHSKCQHSPLPLSARAHECAALRAPSLALVGHAWRQCTHGGRGGIAAPTLAPGLCLPCQGQGANDPARRLFQSHSKEPPNFLAGLAAWKFQLLTLQEIVVEVFPHYKGLKIEFW